MQFTRAEGECPEGKTWKGSDLDGEGAVQCTGEQGGWLPGRSWPGVAGQTMATKTSRNSLAVLWLGLHALTTKDLGSIPRRGTKIPQAVAWSQRPREPPGQATRGRGGCARRGGGCELQTWQPHTEQLPEGLRALSWASGFQSEWTAGGCGFGEALGLFGKGCRKAAPRLSQRGRVWAGG